MLGLLVAWALAAPAAPAEALPDLPRALARAPVGAWVIYRVSGGPGRGPAFWRLAVVRGAAGAGRGRWLEMELGTSSDLSAPLAQLRVRFEPGGRPSRVLARVGAGRIRELPPAELSRLAPVPWPVPGARFGVVARAEVGPPERTMTRAGTVRATRVALWVEGVVVERLWLAEEVPVLGLARWEAPAGRSLEVEAWGFGAEPRVQMTDGPKLQRGTEVGQDWMLPVQGGPNESAEDDRR